MKRPGAIKAPGHLCLVEGYEVVNVKKTSTRTGVLEGRATVVAESLP